MSEETISKIQAVLKELKTPDKKRKAELVRLVASLKKRTAPSAKGVEKLPDNLSGSLQNAVTGLESSHPTLVKAVNELCRELVALGI